MLFISIDEKNKNSHALVTQLGVKEPKSPIISPDIQANTARQRDNTIKNKKPLIVAKVQKGLLENKQFITALQHSVEAIDSIITFNQKTKCKSKEVSSRV